MFFSGIDWPNKCRCGVMLSFDVDGNSNWLFRDPQNAFRPSTMSMANYGPFRGVSRLLDLLDQYKIKATFFIPGFVAEHFPEQVKKIYLKGHEIGNHGYQHELFSTLSIDEQRKVIQKGIDIIENITGERPVGFRTPSGDFISETPKLLLEMGFKYSSSMRGDDRPYRTIINGELSELIEIPAHWELDDFPLFGYNFYPHFPKGQCHISSHSHAFEMWAQDFEGYYQMGCNYVIMCHPQVIGKPGRVLILEKLIQYIMSHSGVWFATAREMAEFWRANYNE